MSWPETSRLRAKEKWTHVPFDAETLTSSPSPAPRNMSEAVRISSYLQIKSSILSPACALGEKRRMTDFCYFSPNEHARVDRRQTTVIVREYLF